MLHTTYLNVWVFSPSVLYVIYNKIYSLGPGIGTLKGSGEEAFTWKLLMGLWLVSLDFDNVYVIIFW